MMAIAVLGIRNAHAQSSMSQEEIDSRLNATVSANELLDVLRTKDIDAIKSKLQTIQGMKSKRSVLPLLNDLWNGETERYQDVPWDVVELDIIRVDIANILIQGKRSGDVEIDSEEFHDFALDQVSSENNVAATKAILLLMFFDDPEDVARLVEIAKEERPGTFSAAVATLSMHCNPKAVEELEALKWNLIDPQSRAYVEEVLEIRSNSSPKIREHFCKRSL